MHNFKKVLHKSLLILFISIFVIFIFSQKINISAYTENEWGFYAATSFAGGDGTEVDPYQISTAEELAYFSKSVFEGQTYAGKYIILTQPVDLSGTDKLESGLDWSPIGTEDYNFEGIFDGNNQEISNLSITDVSPYLGLFGIVGGSTIENVVLSNVYLNNGDYNDYAAIGALAGYASGYDSNNYFKNCVVNGVTIVATGTDIGGMFGDFTDSNIEGCQVYNANISVVGSGVGGIYGVAYYNIDENIYKIIDSSASGTVFASDGKVGGIGGWHYNGRQHMINTISYVNVSSGETATGAAGGLIGLFSSEGGALSLTIENSYNFGSVSGAKAAGFVGYSDILTNSFKIMNSVSAGQVSGTTTNSLSNLSSTENSVEFTNNYIVSVNPAIEVASFPSVISITGFDTLDYQSVTDTVKTLEQNGVTNDLEIVFSDSFNTRVLLDGVEQVIQDNKVIIEMDSISAGLHSVLMINSESEKTEAFIKFNFSKLSASIEVLSEDENKGTVQVTPEITGPVSLGTVLEIQAFPNTEAGYIFSSWKDFEGNVLSYDEIYHHTVNEDNVITAYFSSPNDVFNGLEFTNDATYPWTFVEKLGKFAISSSIQAQASKETSISIEITETGAYSFEWFVSSESVNYDWLSYSVNGTEIAKIGGTAMTDWKTVLVGLKAGDVISWKYRKDGSGNSGDDAGFITGFRRLEGNVTVSVQPNDISNGTVNSSISLESAIPLGTEITVTATSNAGFKFSNWSDSSGLVSRENPYTFIVLEETHLVAYFANYREFFGDDNFNIDYDYPFEISQYQDKQVIQSTNQGISNSISQISYTAPQTGAYSFEWFVSSESVSWDWLSYSINGNQIAKIGGTSMAAWETIIVGLNAGDVITWIYRKDSSGDKGTDTGYVANFKVAEGTANITTSLKTEGSGTITANTELTNVPLGTVVTLTPVPTENYAFFAWLDSTGKIISYNENYTFILVRDFSIVAEFRASYEVTNASELQAMNNDKSGVYYLRNNIDLTGIAWTSIGTSDNPFVGKFYGNGFTLSNLNASGGLFGYTNASTIEDLILENFVINGGGTIGILGNVSTNDTINQISIINSSIRGNTIVGGLFATSGNSVIDTLTITNINVYGTGATVGGVFGKNTATVTLRNAIITGKVEGRSNSVGGILGSQGGTINIYNTTTYANVFAANHLVGGISGAYTGTINLYDTFMRGNIGFGGSHNNNYPYWGVINGYGAWNSVNYENSGQEISVDFRTSISVNAIDIFNVETEPNGKSIPVPTPVDGIYSFDARLLLETTTASFGLLSETSPNGVTGNYGGFVIRFTMEDGTFKYISTLDRVNAMFISNFTGENQVDLDNLTSYIDNFSTMTIDQTIGTGTYKTELFEGQEVSIWGTVLVDNANDYEHLTWRINGGIPTIFPGEPDNYYYNCRSIVTLSIKLTNDIDLTEDRYAISEGENVRLVSLTEYNEYAGDGKKFILNKTEGLEEGTKLYQYYGLGSSEMYPYRGSLYGNNHSLTVNMDFPKAYLVGIINLSSDMSYQTVVSNLSVYGTIRGKYRVGIVGMFDGYSRSGKILFTNVTNYANISGTGTGAVGVGAFLGRIHKTEARFNNCINYGFISSGGTHSGIFVGTTGTSSSHGGLYAFTGTNVNYGSANFAIKPYGFIWDATKATGLDTIYDGYTIDFGAATTEVDLKVNYTSAGVNGSYETTLNPLITDGIYSFTLPYGSVISSIQYKNEFNLDFVEMALPGSNNFEINLIKSISLKEDTLVVEEKIVDASVEYFDGTIETIQYTVNVDLSSPTLVFKNVPSTNSQYVSRNISFNRISPAVTEYVDRFREIQSSTSNQDYLDNYYLALTRYTAIIDSLEGDADSLNYLANYLNQESVTKAALDNYADMITASVNLSNIIDVTYGEEVVYTYDVTLKSISGLDLITTNVEFTSAADLANKKMTLTPVATVISSPIMVSFAFNENCGINNVSNPIGTIKTVNIKARDLSFSMSNQTVTYNGINQVMSYTLSGNLEADNITLNLLYNGNASAISAGTYTVTVAGISGNNSELYNLQIADGYSRTLQINKKAVTITIQDKTSVYGSPLVELESSVEGLVEGDELDPKLEKAAGLTVGSYQITSNASNPNYQITVNNGTYTITPKTITVTPNANQSKVYGELDPEITYLADGLVGEDQLTGSLSRVAGEDVGTYTITLGTLSNPNYSITVTSEVFTITVKAVDVVWVHEESYTYTGSDQSTTVKAYYLNNNGEQVFLDIAFDNEFINAGEYALNASFKETTNNYVLVNPTRTLEIGKANRAAPEVQIINNTQISLTVKAVENGLYRINGGEWQTNNQFTGLVASSVHTVYIKIIEDQNYFESSVNSKVVTLEDKINQNLDLNNINKIYGDLAFELPLVTEEGLPLVYLSSDDSVASISGNLITIHKAGTVKITAVQEGTEIYAAFEKTVDLEIAKKAVIITIQDKTSVYGSPLVELESSVEGLVEGDELDPKLEKAAGLTVGSYQITSNASDPNYQITVNNGTYTITPKAITVVSSISKIYDGNNNVINPIELVGIETGDLVFVDGYYEDANAAEMKNVNFVLSGDAAINYQIIGTYQGIIQKKHIDIQYIGESSLVYTGSYFADIIKANFVGIIEGEEPIIARYINLQNDNEIPYTEIINAGEYQLNITLNSDNYDLEDEILSVDIIVNQKEYVITSDILDSYTYNGESVEINVYANGEPLLQSLGLIEIYLGVEQVFETINAGSYKVLITPVDQNNYRFLDNEIEFVIVPKTVEITFTGTEFTYNEKVQKSTASISNKVIGDDLDLVLSYKLKGLNEESQSINAGSYVLTVLGLSGADKDNYRVNEITHEYIIRKQTISINFGILPSVYNYENQYPQLLFSVSDDIVKYHVEDVHGNIVDEVINAGTYTIVITVLNENYFAQINTREFTIEKLIVLGSVQLNSNSLIYNGNPQYNIVSHTVEKDTEYQLYYLKDGIYLDGVPSMVGIYKVVLVPNDDNVLIDQSDQNYEIKPLPILVRYLNPEVTYNGQVQEINYVIENVVGDDHVELTLTYNDLPMVRDAGVYQVKIVSINNENYTYTAASNTVFTIKKLSLQIKANEMRIRWDHDEVEPTYKLLIGGIESNLPATDSIEVVLYREKPEEKLANKKYAILLDSYLVEDGNSGNNYDVEYIPENYIFEGSVVEVSLENEFTYTGHQIELVLDSGDVPNTIFDIKYYQNDLEITSAELVNSGTYEIRISIKEEFRIQYSFENSLEFISQTFTILKKDISSSINVNQQTAVYTGTKILSIDVTLTGYEDLEIAFVLVNNNNEPVDLLNAGTYSIKIMIIDDNYLGESNLFDFVIEKAENNTQPIANNDNVEVNRNSITIKDLTDVEYSLDGVNWQTNNVFENLTDNESYTVYVRYFETANYLASQHVLIEVITLSYQEFINKVNEISETDILSNFTKIKAAEALRSEIDEDYENLSEEVKTALDKLDDAKETYNSYINAVGDDVVEAEKVANKITFAIVKAIFSLTLAALPIGIALFRKLSLFNRR